ncbi:hypothetical protein V0288_12685 [Pannus brasiliensis CCIBt3594]|uniref:Uncharacterized protein n=1 Tax=Pannus brasiliensis CCIBt3594 TaxID=1427578 RepID=A0AAW9QV52_9CHRO
MKAPLTLHCYKLPLWKRIGSNISLICHRISLFLFVTSFRYPGSSLAIAGLLLAMGTCGEPLSLNHPEPFVALCLLLRVASVALGLAWIGLLVCRLSLQRAQTDSWKQRMRENEEYLRHRVSVLEDWLVFPGWKSCEGTIEVQYRSETPRSPRW